LLTLSEVEGISGEEGNFKVKVRKRARSIDMELCTGCGSCVENCPVMYEAQV
jgi:heterodisulfide reductase subunit A